MTLIVPSSFLEFVSTEAQYWGLYQNLSELFLHSRNPNMTLFCRGDRNCAHVQGSFNGTFLFHLKDSSALGAHI